MLTQSVPMAPLPGEKYRILVAEDDPNIGRLVVINLKAAGFDVRHAPDGVAGWLAYGDFEPHLVILDVMMPGLNGRDLCAKIRLKSTIPIIMMTALDSEQDQLQGFKVGADDYLPKPFNPKLLVARVISSLRRVYRYDATDDGLTSDASNAPSATPSGWATCEACGYMGPRRMFDGENPRGEKILKCPFCGKGEFVSFALN